MSNATELTGEILKTKIKTVIESVSNRPEKTTVEELRNEIRWFMQIAAKSNISLSMVGEKIGKHKATVSNAVSEKRYVSVSFLQNIADAYRQLIIQHYSELLELIEQ